MATFPVSNVYAAIRNDGAALLRLADRAASRIRTPPTLDREDVVQDAVVAIIELIDAGWVPPSAYPTDLALILAATRKLGAKAAYYGEWQWARRRFGIRQRDGEPDGRPDCAVLEPDKLYHPAAPTEGPSPFATTEELLDTLLGFLPAALHATARSVFTGTPVRDLIHAATTRSERKRLRDDYAAIRTTLSAQGLWIDPHGSRR